MALDATDMKKGKVILKTRKDYRPRVYAQIVDEVGRAIFKAYHQERKIDKSLTQAALARTIDKDPAFVNRVLTGGKNMELKSVADFLGALGYEISVELKRIERYPVAEEVKARTNFPARFIPSTTIPIRSTYQNATEESEYV